jgi:hypothetical protein
MLDKFFTIIPTRYIFVGTILLMFFLAGCSSQRSFIEEEKLEQGASITKKLTLSSYEATLNPVDFDQEIEIVEKAHNEERQQLPLEIPKDSMIVKAEEVQGFRVQIFSSSSVDEIALIKNLAMVKFPADSVYVVYDAPVYKLRVGDFLNRYEANQRLPEFVEKKYRDAWVVPDRIIQRKLVRIPIPK